MEQAVQQRLRNTAPPRHARRFFAYVAAVVGLACVALIVVILTGRVSWLRCRSAFWLMAVLAVVVDTMPFLWGGHRDRSPVFPSTCFTFAILIGWGFGPAVVVQTAAVIGAALWLRHKPWRVAFNAAQYVVAFAAAAEVLRLADVPAGARLDGRSVSWIVAAALVWFVVNNVLVATAVWLRFDGRWSKVFARGGAGRRAVHRGVAPARRPAWSRRSGRRSGWCRWCWSRCTR